MIRRSVILFAIILTGMFAVPRRSSGQAPSSASNLQGAWQQEGHSAMMIATPTWVAFFGVDGLPALANYSVTGDRLTLQPSTIGRSFNDQILQDDLGIRSNERHMDVVLERFQLGPASATFVVPNGPTLTWRRLE